MLLENVSIAQSSPSSFAFPESSFHSSTAQTLDWLTSQVPSLFNRHIIGFCRQVHKQLCAPSDRVPPGILQSLFIFNNIYSASWCHSFTDTRVCFVGETKLLIACRCCRSGGMAGVSRPDHRIPRVPGRGLCGRVRVAGRYHDQWFRHWIHALDALDRRIHCHRQNPDRFSRRQGICARDTAAS